MIFKMNFMRILFEAHRKIVFWPNIGVGLTFQVLKILQYSCVLKCSAALILNQNSNFEIGFLKVLDLYYKCREK